MNVRRHTNAYGNHTQNSPCEETQAPLLLPYGNPGKGTFLSARSTRLQPRKGGISSWGFRYPTQFGAVAFRAKCGDYEYKTKVFKVKGFGCNANHVVPRPYGFTSTAGTVVVTVDANLVNRARVEALNKLKSGDFDLGVALAEMSESTRFLAISVKRLISAIRAILRGDLASLLRTTGVTRSRGDRWGSNLADNWLNYQYAFLPLMSDIYAAQELLKEGFRNAHQLFSVERTVSSGLNPSLFTSRYGYAEFSGKATESVRVKLFARVSNSFLHGLNSLGLLNPLTIAWELVPFSFVVDWLYPIGNFLDALTATIGIDFVAGFEDRVVQCKLTARAAKFPLDTITGDPCRANFQQFAWERRIMSTWPLPVPYWKNPFSTSHVLSALALLRSLR